MRRTIGLGAGLREYGKRARARLGRRAGARSHRVPYGLAARLARGPADFGARGKAAARRANARARGRDRVAEQPAPARDLRRAGHLTGRFGAGRAALESELGRQHRVSDRRLGPRRIRSLDRAELLGYFHASAAKARGESRVRHRNAARRARGAGGQRGGEQGFCAGSGGRADHGADARHRRWR